MCKKASEIALVLALLGALTACGSSPASSEPPESAEGSPVIAADEPGLLSSKADAPLPNEPVQPVSAASQGEEPEIKDSPGPGSAPVLAAYKAVLEDIYYDHKFPNGEDYGYLEPLTEDANTFAIYDVDGDGREELIISYTCTYNAGMIELVLDYDETAGTVSEEFSAYPLLTYYDNGVIQADWSHNQGKAGDSLWPYTFWRYDAASDSYFAEEMVDAWDKLLAEDGFPDDVDRDGDGVVYFIMAYGNYDTSWPVDGEAYRQWRDSYIGGAAPLEPPFVALTEENIQAVK